MTQDPYLKAVAEAANIPYQYIDPVKPTDEQGINDWDRCMELMSSMFLTHDPITRD